MLKDVGARELRDLGLLRERERGGLEVGLVELDPTPLGLDEGTRLRGELGDRGGVELEVVEQHRPLHLRKLTGTDDRRLGDTLGAQLESGLGLAR